jgi:branched-chain amino acid transport system ATP-binding protein
MSTVLDVVGITAGYGRVEVLHDLSLAVPDGRVVAVLGPNGVGKTTLLRVIAGLLPAWSGEVRFDGDRIDGRMPHEIARRGVVLVPEGRGVFPGLSVEHNLSISARADRRATSGERRERLDAVFDIFPKLRDRLAQRAGTLSGGEQQMLSLSRAFLARPRVLLVDELSMGLAPILVEELFESVTRLKEAGTTIVLVEQYLTHALALADVCYVLAKGRVVFAGEPWEVAEHAGDLALTMPK